MKKTRTTPSQENYIEHIYRLSATGPVRQAMLSKKLGIQRASVTKFVASLARDGFVCAESAGEIILTKAGKTLAREIIRRDECLTRFLVEICGMTPEEADPEVHRLEHVLSDEVLTRMEVLVGFATSSEAWLKRLHLRMDAAVKRRRSDTAALDIGASTTHPGARYEKY
ncbi:MAG: metal-dependent transcriptional regulator [Desulfobacterales bacterium]|nr:metal-dependent transcriptional regulator [Desulfobacterales bacterium]